MIREILGVRKLKLELDGGMDGDRQLKRSRTFSNINLESSTEDLYDVGKSLADLQELELLNIRKIDESVLVGE